MEHEKIMEEICKLEKLLQENGYSAFCLVSKDDKLKRAGWVGEIYEIVNGFARMFTDTAQEDAPENLKILCSLIFKTVSEYQTLAVSDFFGVELNEYHFDDDDFLEDEMGNFKVRKTVQLGDCDAN